MSEIPYFFHTPVPKYFSETGWFDNPNSILFITWAFARCSPDPKTTVHDYTELNLEPFEFITGLGKNSKESHLSEGAFKHQLKMLVKAGLLKKTTNSRANRFTCYVWVWSKFCKPNNQLNNQLTTNSQPTEQPQSRRKKIRSKKDLPSSLPSVDGEDKGMIDDSLSIDKIEIYQGVFLTQAEIDECVKSRGDLDTVKSIIHQAMNWKGRKYAITDWVGTITTWKLQNMAKKRANDHEAYAMKIIEAYPEFKDGNGWRCRRYRDKNKDQIGILFESESPYKSAIFIDFLDPELKIKCANALRENKMQKGRIKN